VTGVQTCALPISRVTVTISKRRSVSDPWVQVVTISWLKTMY